MYGMVNRAIEDLVVSSTSVEVWNQIKDEAGIELAAFVDSSQYTDELTYKLVEAASKVLGQPADDILHAFGRHWILYTGKEGWASVFDLGGDNMLDFINGLDSMHSRVQVALPDAQMPEFSVVEHADYLELTYRSHRVGLAPMVRGLLEGLAEQFDEEWLVEHVQKKSEHGSDLFHLRQAQYTPEDIKDNAA